MKNLNEVTFKCSGCSTCMQICPKKAIVMKENEEGFKEYYIDEKKCIKCGICTKKCPQINKIIYNEDEEGFPYYYAAYIKNNNKLKKSASGGIFQEVADAISNKNKFAIFGCRYDENFKAIHCCIENKANIDCLFSSKYVQSDIENIYFIVKQKLEENKVVLFSGTPCQIAGLYSFLLPKKWDNLYTIDIICHGVPSPLLFKKYVNYIEKKNNGKLSYYNFRSKDKNTWDDRFKYIVGKKSHGDNYYFDSYYYNFIKGTNYRECCYNCKYAKKERISDMTIGDYWGIEEAHPSMINNLGVSLVIINTKNGEKLFELIKNNIKYCESTFDKMSKHNHNLISPTSRPKIRDVIYNGIKTKDYYELKKENLKYRIPIKVWLNKKCPTFIKKNKNVEVVKAVSLPAGIVDNIDLVVYDKDLKGGEIVVMCSDRNIRIKSRTYK